MALVTTLETAVLVTTIKGNGSLTTALGDATFRSIVTGGSSIVTTSMGPPGARGETGFKGDKGDPSTVPGPKGDTGAGVPSGGSIGQYLRKASNADYAFTWGSLDVGTAAAADTGVSGHRLGFLDTSNFYSANQYYSGGRTFLHNDAGSTIESYGSQLNGLKPLKISASTVEFDAGVYARSFVTVAGDVSPVAANTNALGDPTYRWRNVYAANADIAGPISTTGKLTLGGSNGYLSLQASGAQHGFLFVGPGQLDYGAATHAFKNADASRSYATLNSGGLTLDGNAYVRDLYASRGDGTGAVFFKDNTRYIHYDGSRYVFGGAAGITAYGGVSTLAELNVVGGFSALNRATVSGTGAPLTINSINSNGNKIVFQSAGTNVGYIGGSTSTPFQVQDVSGNNILTLDTAGKLTTNSVLTNTVQANNGLTAYGNISLGGPVFASSLQTQGGLTVGNGLTVYGPINLGGAVSMQSLSTTFNITAGNGFRAFGNIALDGPVSTFGDVGVGGNLLVTGSHIDGGGGQTLFIRRLGGDVTISGYGQGVTRVNGEKLIVYGGAEIGGTMIVANNGIRSAARFGTDFSGVTGPFYVGNGATGPGPLNFSVMNDGAMTATSATISGAGSGVAMVNINTTDGAPTMMRFKVNGNTTGLIATDPGYPLIVRDANGQNRLLVGSGGTIIQQDNTGTVQFGNGSLQANRFDGHGGQLNWDPSGTYLDCYNQLHVRSNTGDQWATVDKNTFKFGQPGTGNSISFVVQGQNPNLVLHGDSNSYYPTLEFKAGAYGPDHSVYIQGYDGLRYGASQHRFASQGKTSLFTGAGGTQVFRNFSIYPTEGEIGDIGIDYNSSNYYIFTQWRVGFNSTNYQSVYSTQVGGFGTIYRGNGHLFRSGPDTNKLAIDNNGVEVTGGLKLTPGAPASPTDGTVWTTSDGLYVRLNGVTYKANLTAV